MEFKLNSCCCCFDLKAGIVVIGIMSLIGEIVQLTAPFSGNDMACNRFYLKNCADLNSGESSAITIWNMMNIVGTIMMIHGSQKNKVSFMLPSIIFSIIGMILYLGIIWAISIKAFVKEHDNITGIIMLIVGHAIFALIFYFFMVIYSRYKDLRNDQLPVYPKENYPLYA